MSQSIPFIPDRGQTTALVHSIDWSKHALGPTELWPAPLRVTLGILFGSSQPMFLWWGRQLFQFYNDACLPGIGEHKHPSAMGQRGDECWQGVWAVLAPHVNAVYNDGKATWFAHGLMPFFRNRLTDNACWACGFSAVFDEEGCVVGVLGTCVDTTAAVHATMELKLSRACLAASQEALLVARRELEAFLLQAPVGIALLRGPYHSIKLINSLCRKLVFGGRPESDFLGKTLCEVVPDVEDQGFLALLDGVYHTGQPFVGAKVRASLQQLDGTLQEMFVNFTYEATRDATGKINGVLVVVYEVTSAVNEQQEIRLLAKNLRAAIRSRDAFLTVASHELNTPLTILKMQTQLHQRLLARSSQSLPPERLVHYLDLTVHQIDRLQRLVIDMLDVSLVSNGKLPVLAVPCDLSALIAENLNRFAPQLEAAGCAALSDITPGIMALVDAPRIEQVFANFIANALKYARGKPVRATVRKNGSMSRVSVCDAGCGIALKDQQRIFGRFERATCANEVSGLGLGLYICQQIIQQHGGQLYIESKLGAGSTFSFELPLVNGVDTTPTKRSSAENAS